MNGRILASWLSGYPLKTDGLKGDNATYTYGNVTKIKPDHLYDAAKDESSEEVDNFLFNTYSQWDSLRGTMLSSRYRHRSLDAQKDWDSKDIDFRRERTKVVRDIAEEKVRQASIPGGTLNYKEKIEAINSRIDYDYREAIARLKVVQEGLAKLHGYDDPLPSFVEFDAIVLWVRRALNFVIRFTRVEQNYILPISLHQLKERRLATETNHKTEWTFKLEENHFPHQSHIRLRGVGLAVIGSNLRGIWQAVLRAPIESFCRFSNGAKSELSQSDVPPVFLGKVAERTAFRDPDVAGINALFNASPLNDWTLTVSERSTEGMKISDVDDIQIELHLAIRTLA